MSPRGRAGSAPARRRDPAGRLRRPTVRGSRGWGPNGPRRQVQLRPDRTRTRRAPGPLGVTPGEGPPSPSPHGAESVQGGTPREDAGMRDLRRGGAGRAGRGAPPLRGPRLALRGASFPRVPEPSRGAGSGRVAVARLVGRRLPDGPAGPVARHPPGTPHRVPAGPGASGLLFVVRPAHRGRARLLLRRAPGRRHRAPEDPRRAVGGGAAPVGAHHAPLVPRGALAGRGRARRTGAGPGSGSGPGPGPGAGRTGIPPRLGLSRSGCSAGRRPCRGGGLRRSAGRSPGTSPRCGWRRGRSRGCGRSRAPSRSAGRVRAAGSRR